MIADFCGEGSSVTLFFDDIELEGEATLDGDNWSFEIPAEFLTEGEHTIFARVSEGGAEPFISDSETITITVECSEGLELAGPTEVTSCEENFDVTVSGA